MASLGKAVAAVVRVKEGQHELLVFQHPQAGMQIPKGTIEPYESIAEATLRELEEESGLNLAGPPEFVGKWERNIMVTETQSAQRHVWYVSTLKAPADVQEQWSHEARGSEEERGLIFDYRWLPIDASLPGKLHPLFQDVSAMLVKHFPT
jgi:8-oxo-dGTP pyrophosphatase MutT (NUDIX family)